jgi:hypothetical protein
LNRENWIEVVEIGMEGCLRESSLNEGSGIPRRGKRRLVGILRNLTKNIGKTEFSNKNHEHFECFD